MKIDWDIRINILTLSINVFAVWVIMPRWCANWLTINCYIDHAILDHHFPCLLSIHTPTLIQLYLPQWPSKWAFGDCRHDVGELRWVIIPVAKIVTASGIEVDDFYSIRKESANYQ